MTKDWRLATLDDLKRKPKPKPATTIEAVPGQPWIFIKTTRRPK